MASLQGAVQNQRLIAFVLVLAFVAISATHKTIPTPNPAFRSLRVVVGEDSYASNGGLIPKEGTLYKDPAFKGLFAQDYRKEFEDFRYVTQDQGNDGALLFVRSMTNNQRLTPYRTITSFGGEFVWDAILKALVFIPDRNFGRSTNGIRNGRGAVISGPQYYVRQVYQPAVRRGTRFITQYFFSDKPYNIGSQLVPIPRSVFYDVPGAQGYFPDCLGPEVRIPDTQTANAAFVAGAQAYASGALQGQYFPATNFEEWSPYFSKIDQDFQNGYLMTRTMAIPPLVDDDPNIR